MVIDLGVNRKRICDFLLVSKSNFGRICYRFEILTLKARKWLIFPPHLYLTPQLEGNALEFLDETYIAKTRGMGLPYGKNIEILTSAVLD